MNKAEIGMAARGAVGMIGTAKVGKMEIGMASRMHMKLQALSMSLRRQELRAGITLEQGIRIHECVIYILIF